MKVAVYGIDDFPFGKKTFRDGRIETLQEIFKAKKITPLQIEFVVFDELKDAEGVVTSENNKLDLVLADLEYVAERLTKEIPPEEKILFEKAKQLLEQEQFLSAGLTDEERKLLKGFPLSTHLPVFVFAQAADCENQEILKSLYEASGRTFFFTAGEKEVRMWPIRKGQTAWEAAGCIHSDIQQGFIRAETVGIDDILSAGHYNQARNEGKIRLENKEYVIKEADVILFRFNK